MKFRKPAVLAMSLAMVLTMSASVFAANGANSGANNGAPSYNAEEAKLVKYLEAPEGVDVAATTFTFKFTPVAGNQSDYVVPVGDYTAFSKTIRFNPAKGAADNEMTSAGVSGTQNMKGSKSIGELFDGYNFKRAGEYTFSVSEEAPSTVPAGWTYSSETYTLRLVVANTEDGGTEITDVTVQEGPVKVDAGDDNPADNTDPKDPDAEPAPANSLGGFTFVNKYAPVVTKHDEPKDPNPDPNPEDPANPDPVDEKDLSKDVKGAFVLDKFVLGEYGDQTKKFDFNVTVELPAVYKDFKLPDGWKDGEEKKVELAHGDQQVFDALPAGTRITVAESDYSGVGYTTHWTTSDDKDVLTVVVGDNGAYAICRNAFEDESVTPTGIIINNLPYVLLIAIALGGIVLFSRKRRYE